MGRTCYTHAKWEMYTKLWLENEQLGVKKWNRFNWLESQLFWT